MPSATAGLGLPRLRRLRKLPVTNCPDRHERHSNDNPNQYDPIQTKNIEFRERCKNDDANVQSEAIMPQVSHPTIHTFSERDVSIMNRISGLYLIDSVNVEVEK